MGAHWTSGRTLDLATCCLRGISRYILTYLHTDRPARAAGCKDTHIYTRARTYTHETRMGPGNVLGGVIRETLGYAIRSSDHHLATSSGVLDVLTSSGGAGPICDMLPGSPADVPTLPLEVYPAARIDVIGRASSPPGPALHTAPPTPLPFSLCRTSVHAHVSQTRERAHGLSM